MVSGNKAAGLAKGVSLTPLAGGRAVAKGAGPLAPAPAGGGAAGLEAGRTGVRETPLVEGARP